MFNPLIFIDIETVEPNEKQFIIRQVWIYLLSELHETVDKDELYIPIDILEQYVINIFGILPKENQN